MSHAYLDESITYVLSLTNEPEYSTKLGKKHMLNRQAYEV